MQKWIRASILFCAISVWMLFGAGYSGSNSSQAEVLPVFAEQPVPLAQAPVSEPEPEPEPEPQDRRITLVVTGDLMVHGEQLQDALDPATGLYDFSHCFVQVEEDLAEGYAVGNLETVFAGAQAGYSDYPRFNTPDSYGQALHDAGFDFLTTANNHSMDKDAPGLLRTLEVLDGIGLAHTGTFASREARDALHIEEIEGIRIAFLSYTFSTNGIPLPEDQPYLVNMMDEALVLADLDRAKAAEPDFIVVLPHMGEEYESAPRAPFERWMELMFEHGADIVLASHPHVLQRMETRQVTDGDGGTRDCFVIYSLGNFISAQRYEPREIAIMLKLDLLVTAEGEAVLEGVRFVPTWVQFTANTGQSMIRVLPIMDAITDYRDENTLLLREWDIPRLTCAHAEITALYLGAAVPDDEMQREYTFYSRQAEPPPAEQP